MTGISLLLGMWFGPALAAILLALRRPPGRRRSLLWAALVALAPFILLEAVLLAAAVRGHYSGFCHHAPDIRYACSYPRYLLESVLPFGSFAVIGLLILGLPAFVWGLISVLIGLKQSRRV